MTANKKPLPRSLIMLLGGAFMPVAALAHPGHADLGASFMAGVMHPLTGLDHVLMIVAVSLWATQLQAMGRVAVAACLGLFVAIGALAPLAPPAGMALEMAIALTVIGAGLLLAAGRRWPLRATAGIAALFALIHGFAHGAEGPDTSLTYVPGIVVATAGLALVVAGLAAHLREHSRWLRAVGALSAATGAIALLTT